MEYRQAVAARVVELVVEANGGKWPESIWQWRRVSRRYGVRWKLVSLDILPEPILRRGVLYLPRLRHKPALLERFLTHELAEAVLCWEGEPPYNHPGDFSERHEIACLVEISAQTR